ncbi:hypothetical protein [Salinibacter ruber]|uniref:hypothetical protein n=1 Tax=Salinibacter ruber TaxID=146919 RepID=UPI0020730198|nr:hypothetical protein [Salinibacter ruber]
MPVALQPARTGLAARTGLTVRILLRACLIGKIGTGRETPSSEEMLSAGRRGAMRKKETVMKREKASSLPAARFPPRLRWSSSKLSAATR